ncbi:MAG: tail fiber protein [Pseudomonadota bacterium]
MDPLLGQIIMFGGNFAPRGWALCDGQLLSVTSYSALFSILGTTYGGDGRTTFALPDLRGRAPIHAGQGPGLSDHRPGQKGGNETTTLTPANLPPHKHDVTVVVEAAPANLANPTGNMFAAFTGFVADTAATEVNMSPKTIAESSVGTSTPFSNEMPYLAMNYIIALEGTYPSRS